MSRIFLVARESATVVIREVEPSSMRSLDHVHTRESAWAFAHKLAKPCVRQRRKAAQIDFMGLDKMSTVVKTAADVMGELETPTPAPVAPAEQPVKWVDQDPRNKEAYEYLFKLNLDGKLNEFTFSLHEQLDRRGNLTDNQRDALLRNRRPEQSKQELPEVPAGRYAIEVDGNDDETIVTKFYRVDRPTQGRWEGYTFVKVQAGDDFYPVRGAAAKSILSLIAQDPMAASLRYGREIGSCGVCGLTLTKEESREEGIGPICKGKMGW